MNHTIKCTDGIFRATENPTNLSLELPIKMEQEPEQEGNREMLDSINEAAYQAEQDWYESRIGDPEDELKGAFDNDDYSEDSRP